MLRECSVDDQGKGTTGSTNDEGLDSSDSVKKPETDRTIDDTEGTADANDHEASLGLDAEQLVYVRSIVLCAC